MSALRTRPARRALAATVALGALGSVVLTAGAASATPASSGPPMARSVSALLVKPTPQPDLQGLRTALQGVVTAGAPGAFARVSDAGSADRSVSVGTGDLSTNSPVDPNGQFRVGSINKNFTAVLVLQLVAQGKVNLDAPAAGYLAAGVLPANSAITVRELLNHTSGLYDYTNDILAGSTIPGYQNFRYKVYKPEDLVAQALAHGSQFTPGARYQYSNTNFVVLGLLVEHLTGQPYAKVLSDRILTPLGMTHT
ncbi:MAG TPA: serine hydrolase domain-containing protein, partial [Streptomyces sp.]